MQTNPRVKQLFIVLLLSGILVTVIHSCRKTYYFRNVYQEHNTLIHESQNLQKKPFLKAHMHSGDVYILRDSWQLDSINSLMTGKGTHYNFNRSIISEGELSFPLDSVALFESNVLLEGTEDGRKAALMVLAAVDLAMGFVCLTNPKACYGSCPTFYVNPDDNFHYADAEGFSNAILPSLEYGDVDALSNVKTTRGSFSLYMKNEALETHCLNDVRLLACPRNSGERVYQTRTNRYYKCENIVKPSRATGPEGDVLELLALKDRRERYSLADAENLKSREEIHLSFNNAEQLKEAGLLISFRQTLMTTYFIYSALGYMGDEAVDILAGLEREGEVKEKLNSGFQKELGEVEVHLYHPHSGEWQLQGSFYETGPIAINEQILPLVTPENSSGEIKIKLVLNKGLWRIDQVALTEIKEEVSPMAIGADAVWRGDKPAKELQAKLNDSSSYLISMPGEEYRFDFNLPDSTLDYELFLYSEGYYLEWMRHNWFQDKNLLKLKQMFDFPTAYLRREAAAYKQYEATMEDQFWSSRINTKTYSYDEKN